MKINPTAFALWAFGALVGHLIGGITGAEIGLVIAIALTLFAELS